MGVFLHGNQRICLHTRIFCSRQVAISENYIFNENNPVKDHDTDGDGDDEDGEDSVGSADWYHNEIYVGVLQPIIPDQNVSTRH